MKKKGSYSAGLIIAVISLAVMFFAVPAQADVTWDWTWNGTGTWTADYPTPTNGWVTINATNNSSFAWGDFHVEIFACGYGGCGDITNVDFIDGVVDSMTSPDSDRSPFTYNIDNASVGAKLDYFYYSDPIGIGQTGQFKFKVANPDGVLYTTAFTPTVVPEPISSTLFIVGAATFGYRRFRKRA